jgi:Methyltransferase domain
MKTQDSDQSLMARQKMKNFPRSNFTGPYEQLNVINGMLQEQWLWKNRSMVHGTVVDMSTPRHFHEFIYTLPQVDKVLISDLDQQIVKKSGYESPVDIIGDFCATPPPMPHDSADTIICLSILEHVEDPFDFMKNLQMTLSPGGVLFIWTPFAYTDGHMGPDGPDYWRFGRDAHVMLGRKAGLETISVGQFIDMGQYYKHELGRDLSAKKWNRGVPASNWSIHLKPSGNRAQGQIRESGL